MKMRNLLAAAAFAVVGTVGHAATISLSSGVAPEPTASVIGQAFVPQLTTAGATHLYRGPMTLLTNGPVRLTFTLVGAESAFRNTLLFSGSDIITENGNGSAADFETGIIQGESFEVASFDGDLASVLTFEAFDFSTTSTFTFNAGDDEFGVFADSSKIGALKTFYLGLDDDGAGSDDNHDDIVVRVDVSAVPLPASGLLLIAGLGGAFGFRRLRKST